MADAKQLSEWLVHCCSMGDPHTLRQVRMEYPEADFNMTTEGGVTLLMHTIIGAGMYFLIQIQQPHPQTHSHGWSFPSCIIEYLVNGPSTRRVAGPMKVHLHVSFNPNIIIQFQ